MQPLPLLGSTFARLMRYYLEVQKYPQFPTATWLLRKFCPIAGGMTMICMAKGEKLMARVIYSAK